MKRLLFNAALLLLSSAALADGAIVHINGMVCAFCANGIEKSFKKQAAVEKVAVSLEAKTVTLAFKPKQAMNDKQLQEVITDAGYTVVKIERN